MNTIYKTLVLVVLLCSGQQAMAQDFITQWNLATAGSGTNQLTFGTATSGTVNYTWQEISPGSTFGSGSWSGATLTITGLPTGATIRLQIVPANFQRIIINNGLDRSRLTQVEQWGSTTWTSMQDAFDGCTNLQVMATDVPNLSGLTNMSEMFRRCSNLNSPNNIGSWNTVAVNNMQQMFSGASAFNQSIGAWNTGAVTTMREMFSGASAFNQNIGAWSTGVVTIMEFMFYQASAFNQNIGAWNTGAVTNMSTMFSEADAFNQNIGSWNTSAVTDMSGMFTFAFAFNQNIGAWTLNPAVDIRFMLDDSGMDCSNYSATLIGWSANPSTPNSRTLAATGRQYGTNAVAARNNLTVIKGWTITGDTPSGSSCGSVLVPTITSFTPSSGSIGTSVTITGTNFSTTPASNIVQFNGTTGVVTASTATSITTTVPSGATTGTIAVTVAGNTATSITNFTVTAGSVITINLQPTPSTVCEGATTTFTTAASGTTNITYQWQFSTTLTGTYNDIANGAGYSNVATASLSVNTTGNFGAGFYSCKVNGDLAATVFSNAAELTVNAVPSTPIIAASNLGCAPASTTLNPTGASAGQEYKFYNVSTGGTPLNSGTFFTTPVLTVSTTYHISTYNTTTLCESARVPAVVNVQSCNPPVVEPSTATAFIEGIVTIDLEVLISDVDDNLDPSTLQIITQPVSGAPASLAGFILMIDYTGVPFPGTDNVEIEICDLTGICAQQELTIELGGEIEVFNALSPNNDGVNDTFIVQYIELFPDTKKNLVTIYNRWGDVVFEVSDYNNDNRVFRGLNKNDKELPSGTYFYKIEFTSARKSETGYISLKR